MYTRIEAEFAIDPRASICRNVKFFVSKTCIHISDTTNVYTVWFIVIIPIGNKNCQIEKCNKLLYFEEMYLFRLAH